MAPILTDSGRKTNPKADAKGRGFGKRWGKAPKTPKTAASALTAVSTTDTAPPPPMTASAQKKTKKTSAASPQNTKPVQDAAIATLVKKEAKRTDPANINRLALIQENEEADATEDHGLTGYLLDSHQEIWAILLNTVDMRLLSRKSKEEARQEIHESVKEIVHFQKLTISSKEIATIARHIANEMLGLGPLESLIARDDVTEIMVNGPKTVYVEVNGLVERSAVTFRDNQHLIAVCQRIAAKVGRRVDDSCPICDARLEDGSRVNIILPPLALDGAVLTIRKFQKDRITLDKLLSYGSIDKSTAELIRIISACRINVLVSGGTGSGKTTMLNCLTGHIHPRERIVTCEDSAELQLQQPHVVRLETCPPNLEGVGEVKMRDLIRNCLRMRPERIIVGEVRGPEAFDLLQAMSTGHDGSMGTVHANTPRDALSRLENMIAMAGLNVPMEMIRRQIASAVNVILHVQRLHDGSRKVTAISEITGMEGDVISMHDLVVFDIEGEDANGKIKGSFRHTGIKPRFYSKLRQFGMEGRYLDVIGGQFEEETG